MIICFAIAAMAMLVVVVIEESGIIQKSYAVIALEKFSLKYYYYLFLCYDYYRY
jgi:hypothetical protein